MCYPENLAQNPTAKPASEDVHDLLNLEHERTEIENAFQIANINFNNASFNIENVNDAFSQATIDSIETLEQVQPYGIRNAPMTFVETLRNLNETNPEISSDDLNEENEIRAILRGEY